METPTTSVSRPLRQEVRTASKENSIWQAPIDEAEFRRAAVDLALLSQECPWDADIGLAPSPEAPTLVERPVTTLHAQSSLLEYTLKLEDEHRLANDLALISATQEAVFSVTAGCIEEHVDYAGHLMAIRVNLAANEGISDDLKISLQGIWNCLQVDDVVTARQNAFDKIIHLNRTRILQRIRKAVGHPPLFREKGRTRTNPDDRLLRAFVRMRKARLTEAGERFVTRGIDINTRLLQTLLDVTVDDADAASNEVLRALGDVSKMCFDTATDGGRLPFKHLLVDCGLDPQIWLRSKYVGEVDKIGAYWRIAQSLVKIYRKVGSNRTQTLPTLALIVEGVPPYMSVDNQLSIQGRPMPCYVHAEIQLLCHYLRRRQDVNNLTSVQGSIFRRPPRVIGASKSACFLCYLCLTCYGGLIPPATHGRLYDQWTIPDLGDYTQDQTSELRQTILVMHDALLKLKDGYGRKRPRDHPMTSRTDIDRLSFDDPGSNGTPITEPTTEQGWLSNNVTESFEAENELWHPPGLSGTSGTSGVNQGRLTTASDTLHAQLTNAMDSRGSAPAKSTVRAEELCCLPLLSDLWRRFTSKGRRRPSVTGKQCAP